MDIVSVEVMARDIDVRVLSSDGPPILKRVRVYVIFEYRSNKKLRVHNNGSKWERRENMTNEGVRWGWRHYVKESERGNVCQTRLDGMGWEGKHATKNQDTARFPELSSFPLPSEF